MNCPALLPAPMPDDLFLTSGAYQTYAGKYLRPEQMDAVDISKFVG